MTRVFSAIAVLALCTVPALSQAPASQPASAPASQPALYALNIANVPDGTLPDDVMILDGEFAVRTVDGRKVIQMAETPVADFGLMVGPTRSVGTAVQADIRGVARGRLEPRFGVGLAGSGGYRLYVTPAKDALEICQEESVKATAPFQWKSGEWLRMRLELRKAGDKWRLDGRAWPAGQPMPADAMISLELTEAPDDGRASVCGAAISGKPIYFDKILVTEAK